MQALRNALLSYQCRKANLYPNLLLSIIPSRDHLVSLIREPHQVWNQSYIVVWVGNKASSPIQLTPADPSLPCDLKA